MCRKWKIKTRIRFDNSNESNRLVRRLFFSRQERFMALSTPHFIGESPHIPESWDGISRRPHCQPSKRA